MITRQAETSYNEDIVMSHKMCKVFGMDSKILPPSSARRNLFGAGEDETVKELLNEQTIEMAERAAQEWNFDFMKETPIPGGRFLWESVCATKVPSWYSTDAKESSKDEKYRKEVAGKENNVFDVCLDYSSKKGSSGFKCNKVKLVQTSIKGYGRVQKRRTSKRLLQKRSDPVIIKGSSRVADYILRGSSKSS